MKSFFKVLFIIIFIFTFCIVESWAVNKVKVATVGSYMPSVSFNKENPQKTVDYVVNFWERKINQVLPYNPDLIVLPEMFDRPRGLNSEELEIYFKTRGEQIVQFLSSIAKKNSCYISFNTKSYQGKNTYNTSYLMDRNGRIAGSYNKNYPTIYEMDDKIMPDSSVPVFETDFGKVACTVCFDLNFDELREKYVKIQPDIILFSSLYHGGLVQNYWAYSTQAFFVSSIGQSNMLSEILNPVGEVVASSTSSYDFTVAEINLDYEVVHFDYNIEKLKELKEKYKNKVNIHDPDKLGVVLVTSEHENMSIKEMLKEFDIQDAGTYFDDSRKHRTKLLNE